MIQKKFLTSGIFAFLFMFASPMAIADVQKVPLDRSDNRSPNLVSFSFDSLTAPAGSKLGVPVVIRDDKNETYLSTLRWSAPSDAGTLEVREGEIVFVPGTLLSRIIGSGYVEDTWQTTITVPSFVGTWTLFNMFFYDVAGNGTGMSMTSDNCLNINQSHFPNKGSFPDLPCSYTKTLTVTKEVPLPATAAPAPTPTPTGTANTMKTPTPSEVLFTALSSLEKLKSQNAMLIKQLNLLNAKLSKICTTKPKPKGC
jgi:hypothetical protein